jgi:hypothetical protein
MSWWREPNLLMRVCASASTAILTGVTKTGLVGVGTFGRPQAQAFHRAFAVLVALGAIALLAGVSLSSGHKDAYQDEFNTIVNRRLQ